MSVVDFILVFCLLKPPRTWIAFNRLLHSLKLRCLTCIWSLLIESSLKIESSPKDFLIIEIVFTIKFSSINQNLMHIQCKVTQCRISFNDVCSRMWSKVTTNFSLIYVKASQPVLKICKMFRLHYLFLFIDITIFLHQEIQFRRLKNGKIII